jgi:hypothetical protein
VVSPVIEPPTLKDDPPPDELELDDPLLEDDELELLEDELEPLLLEDEEFDPEEPLLEELLLLDEDDEDEDPVDGALVRLSVRT